MFKLKPRMAEFANSLAVGCERAANYCEILRACESWSSRFCQAGVSEGEVVSLEGEYGASTIAAFVELMERGCLIVPLSPDSNSQRDQFLETSQTERRVCVGRDGGQIESTGKSADHQLFRKLRDRRSPGLVLFTSGSTGESKAAVHDLSILLEKFQPRRQQLRTVVFLQLDHIGGVNTLLYTLANGGAVVVPKARSPEAVCRAIEDYQAELLPTSPTFLNLLLISGNLVGRELPTLKLITYGTEPMPESTLKRLHEVLPHVKLQQTYGMTELGILRSKSRSSDSLWVRVGGEGFETKVVEGRLWVRARSAMLGYMNAPSPFDQDGFLDTGDRVEVDGEWIRFLGRASEIINVGGSKVYPAEVESVLLEMDHVVDATVQGETNALVGQVVTAKVRLSGDESATQFKTRMKRFCKTRLPSYAIPARVALVGSELHSSRFKRMRT